MGHISIKSIVCMALYLMAVFAVLPMQTGHAGEALMPSDDKEIHMGVFSCAGSTCHGAVQAWPNSTILQDEYITWQRRDKHAKAYEVLLNEKSKRIAKNLGLEAAEKADICLDCHADNVPKNQRFRTFQISDGVSCEACHGGAGRWVGTHIAANASHANNIKNGLFPTAEPVSRAKLCLSCHFGDESRPMTHRIMGAGHPRMSFELDTFTAIQPAHFKVDKDYRKRKGAWSGVQLWAIGQALAIDSLLKAITDPKRNRDGMFPELALFDCYTCHRPIKNPKWQSRPSVDLGPGIVRINDSNLLMLQIITKRVDPGLASDLKNRSLALHRSITKDFSTFVAEAGKLRKLVTSMSQRFASYKFSKDDTQAMLNAVIASGKAGEFVDFSGAEQATMAVASIINAMRDMGSITNNRFKALDTALKGLFKAVEDGGAYQPKAFVAALNSFGEVLKK